MQMENYLCLYKFCKDALNRLNDWIMSEKARGEKVDQYVERLITNTLSMATDYESKKGLHSEITEWMAKAKPIIDIQRIVSDSHER